jgi:uncharacterized protein YegP (UPF0339 family)
MAAKFEIKLAKNGEFFFHLKAANGEPILASEMYKAKASAEKGIESVRKNSQLDSAYERKVSKTGKPFFTLKAGNNEPIGKSEEYSSESAMEKGIEAVKKAAADAKVEDLTAK